MKNKEYKMSLDTTLRARVNNNLKKDVEHIFDELGINKMS